MIDGEHDKVDEILQLTRENNRMLHSMHRRMIWSQIFTFFYWLVILGVAGWSFYYFQPYLEKYLTTYQSIMNRFNEMEADSKGLPSNFQDILDKMK